KTRRIRRRRKPEIVSSNLTVLTFFGVCCKGSERGCYPRSRGSIPCSPAHAGVAEWHRHQSSKLDIRVQFPVPVIAITACGSEKEDRTCDVRGPVLFFGPASGGRKGKPKGDGSRLERGRAAMPL